MACSLMGHHSKYNTSENLVRIIEQLYDKATRDVQMNGNMGDFFPITVGRQGCFLCYPRSSTFFSRTDHVWWSGRIWWNIRGNITNLPFVDDIYVLAEEERELEALSESPIKNLHKVVRRPNR